jgi:excinuclease UvrABC helicase subunit UvrB
MKRWVCAKKEDLMERERERERERRDLGSIRKVGFCTESESRVLLQNT